MQPEYGIFIYGHGRGQISDSDQPARNIFFMGKNNLPVNGCLLQHILYIQSDKGCSLLVLRDRKQCVIDLTLVQLERLLPSSGFYRVHRSYIINMAAVSEFRYFRKQFLAIVYGYRIPVSRRRKRMLMDSLDII